MFAKFCIAVGYLILAIVEQVVVEVQKALE